MHSSNRTEWKTLDNPKYAWNENHSIVHNKQNNININNMNKIQSSATQCYVNALKIYIMICHASLPPSWVFIKFVTQSQFILFIVIHNLSILQWYLGMLESKCLSEMGVSWVRFGTEEGWWVGLRCLGVVVGGGGGVIVVHILLPWGYTWWDQTHANVHGLRDASLQQL